MDGLMIDSNIVISRAYEAVLREYGVKPKRNDQGIVQTPGISAQDNWRNLVKIYGINEDVELLAYKKNQLQINFIKQGVNAMPGLVSLLDLLSEHQIQMAIASSSIREVVEDVIQQLKIEHFFTAIVAGGEVTHGKPAPDIFLAAAKKMLMDPDDCVAFEDAFDGVVAAKAAGMKCIAVPAKAEPEYPKFKKADIVLPSLGQVNWKMITKLA